jgi:hypothetical protein
MEKLTLENFISAADDFEMSKYIILARLKKYSTMLHQNKLYPALSDLIDIGKVLQELNNQREEISKQFPMQKLKIDIKRTDEEVESVIFNENEVDTVLNLINWASPKIKEAIDEGRAIYDFVDENISIDVIGILPIYINEGYFLITNILKKRSQVYRYYLSIIRENEKPFMTFKTNLVDSFEFNESEIKHPEMLKLGLINKFPDLPNPVLYKIETDIDFPFIETVLPVAKRKLIQQLAA